jgi:hypothetical protein
MIILFSFHPYFQHFGQPANQSSYILKRDTYRVILKEIRDTNNYKHELEYAGKFRADNYFLVGLLQVSAILKRWSKSAFCFTFSCVV